MGTDLGTVICLVVDFVFLTGTYYWYKRSNQTADDIKNAKYLKIDENLEGSVRNARDSCIPYACIEGEVTSVGRTLHSHRVEGQNGVLQHIRLEEHKSQKVEGLWSDAVKVIQDKIQSVPFTLRRSCENEKTVEVEVVDPESANFIMDDLTSIHDQFEPVAAGGFFSRIVDRLSGDVVKGYHESEKMLLNDTTLLGIGEIRYVDGKLQIVPPKSGAKYILTKKSLSEIIKLAEKKSFWIKVLLIGTATVGAALLVKLLYNIYKRRKQEHEREKNHAAMFRMIEEAQMARRESNNEGDGEHSNMCVVCLSNPREIVLLDCGHICLCSECVMQLPLPMSCPVCRQAVMRYIPTFNP